MIRELRFVWTGFKFLLLSSLIMGLGFGLFVFIGTFIMGFIGEVASLDLGTFNPLTTLLFIVLVIIVEIPLLWLTGKYITPFFNKNSSKFGGKTFNV